MDASVTVPAPSVSAVERFDRPLAFVVFSNIRITTPFRSGDVPWQKLRTSFEKHLTNPEKLAIPGFSPVRLKVGTTRADENVIAISCLVIDLDGVPLDVVRNRINDLEWSAHTTHSHTAQNPCWRIIFPLAHDVPSSEWGRFWTPAVDALTGGLADQSCKNPSRFYFLPSAHPDRTPEVSTEHNTGRWVDPDDYLKAPAVPSPVVILGAPQMLELKSNLVGGKIDLGAEIQHGERNNGLTRVAGHFAREGLLGAELFERIQAHNLAKCKPPLCVAEVKVICESVAKRELAGKVRAAQTLETALQQLNEQFAWIETPAAIWRVGAREFVQTNAFKTELCNRMFFIGKKTVELGVEWIRWPQRRQHSKIVFEPQKPAITADGALNLWEGLSVTPAAGDVKPWVDLLNHLFPDRNACTWALQWLAHSVQFPGAKKHSALVCWSRAQGIGKNLLFETVAQLFGRHACVAQPGQLGKQFNAFMRDKVLIISDETGGYGRQAADLIKTWITSSEMVTEQKNQPSVTLRNTTDFIFLGNNADAIHLSPEDRRFGVFEIRNSRLPDLFYIEFVRWRNSHVGLPALLHYLQKVDLTGFDPKGHAPMTRSKQAMIDSSRSGPEQWLLATFVAGTVSSTHGRDLFSALELCRAYEWQAGQKAAAEVMGRTLARLGFPSKRVRVAGSHPFLYALDNGPTWSAQPGPAWATEAAKPSKLAGSLR